VDGSVFIVYNVGLTDHVIRDPFVKLNDHRYHVVRFTRVEANATLQIDDYPVQRLNPTGACCVCVCVVNYDGRVTVVVLSAVI